MAGKKKIDEVELFCNLLDVIRKQNTIIDYLYCMAVQYEDIAEEITKYESDARSYGVTDIKAILMWVEIQHLGGDAACRRIFGRASRRSELFKYKLKLIERSI